MHNEPTDELTTLLTQFAEARAEHAAAAADAEHWPYNHRTADELAADTGDIAVQIVLAAQDAGILPRPGTPR